MKIAVTNIFIYPETLLSQITVTVFSDDNALDTPADMIDNNFNLVYRSAGTDQGFSVRIVPTVADKDVSYVAVGGHNFGDIGGTLEVFVGGGSPPSVGSVSFDAGTFNNVVMIHFPTVTTPTNIELVFTKSVSADVVQISNIHAGLTFDFVSEVNNSEMDGYMRPWIGRTSKTRAPIKGAARPVRDEQERRSTKMKLSIPNLQAADFNITPGSNMFDLLFKLSLETLFYIKEYDGSADVDQPKSSYLGFDAKLSMAAHGSTRALNNLKLSFMAYTGI